MGKKLSAIPAANRIISTSFLQQLMKITIIGGIVKIRRPFGLFFFDNAKKANPTHIELISE
jgi:hypothetical protein